MSDEAEAGLDAPAGNIPAAAAKGKSDKPWVDMAAGEAARTLARSVHYSSKPVNTNAWATGVRLGADERVDLPYVAYSTLRVNRHVTDYLEGGAPAARPFNQAASVIEGVASARYSGCSPAQRTQVLAEAAVLDAPYVTGHGLVDPRLRQLLIPAAAGADGYVSLTPLHSAPFSVELRARLRREEAEHPELVRRRVAVLGIGGANAQNVGRHVGAMSRPLVFMAPTESKSLRRAWAVFYQGVTIESLVPARLVTELQQWRRARRVGGAGTPIESTLQTRTDEARALRAIAVAVVRRAAAIGRTQDVFAEDLGGRVSPTVDAVVRGLLDPATRERDWARQFAERLIDGIERFRSRPDQAALAASGDLASLQGVIEEAVA